MTVRLCEENSAVWSAKLKESTWVCMNCWAEYLGSLVLDQSKNKEWQRLIYSSYVQISGISQLPKFPSFSIVCKNLSSIDIKYIFLKNTINIKSTSCSRALQLKEGVIWKKFVVCLYFLKHRKSKATAWSQEHKMKTSVTRMHADIQAHQTVKGKYVYDCQQMTVYHIQGIKTDNIWLCFPD